MPLKDDANELRGFVKILRDRTAAKQNDEALRESQALYRAIAANLPQGAVFLVDRDLRYRLADGEALREAGFNSGDLEGKRIAEVFPPEVAERLEADYRAIFAGETIQTVHEDHGRSYSSHGVPLRDAGGAVYAALVVSYDISERERLAKAAQTEREQLYAAFQLAPSILAVVRGPDHVYALANEGYYQLIGKRDILGRPAREVVPELEAQGHFDLLDRVYRTGEPYVGTNVPVTFQRTPDTPPEERFMDFVYQPIREPDGRVSGILAHGIDLTDRNLAEAGLRQSEERFRLMADAIPQIVWITDADGRAEFFNRQWEAYTGVPFEPTTAANIAAWFLHPDDGPTTLSAFEEALRSGTTYRVEHRIRSRTGEYRWFLVRAEPHRDPTTGEVIRWFGTSTDIHDAKLTQERLREGEERLPLPVHLDRRGLLRHRGTLRWRGPTLRLPLSRGQPGLRAADRAA